MTYVIEFLRQGASSRDAGVVRRYAAEFEDLGAAEDYGRAHLASFNRADEADGFRIFENGVLRRALLARTSPWSEDAPVRRRLRRAA